MQLEYKRDFDKSFMIFHVSSMEQTFEEQMMVRNRIRMFLPQRILSIDGEKQYWYDITGKDSLKTLIEYGKFEIIDIKRMLLDLQNALEDLKEYLLDTSHIMLSMDTMFLDRAKNQYFFGYNPYQENNFNDNMRALFESILRIMDHSDMEYVKVMYAIYELIQKENFSVEELLAQITVDVQDAYAMNCTIPSVEENPFKAENVEPEKKSKKKKLFALPKITGLSLPERRRKKEEAIFVCEEPHDWDEEEHTMLLVDCKEEAVCCLRYKGSGSQKDIILNSDGITIGSSIENEGVIVSTTVSKRHARITRSRNKFFIEDLNSTNGTYVNDEILNFQEKKILSSQDRVKFADELYIFE